MGRGGEAFELLEVALQHADARRVFRQVRRGVEQRERLWRALAAAGVGRLPCGGARQAQAGFKPGRFVQQQGHRGQRQQAGIRRHGHRLIGAHAGARGFLDLAIHTHKAALDELLGRAARAVQLFGHAFGQADVGGVGVLVGH